MTSQICWNLFEQNKNIDDLTSSLRRIGVYGGGHYVESFLKTCICGVEKCNTLRAYEEAEEVICDDVTFKKQGRHSVYPALSDSAGKLTAKHTEEIESYIPQGSVLTFDVLNPLSWPTGTPYPFNGQLQFREFDLKSVYRAVYLQEDPY